MSPASLNDSVFLEAVRREPERVQDLLDAGIGADAERLMGQFSERFDGVVITGMGSSLHSIYPAFLRLVEAGISTWVIETSELLQYGLGLLTPKRLLWAVSQSGASAEIEALLGSLPKSRPTVLGTVNRLDSPLGEHADVVIEMHAGAETGVGTASYLNTLAANAITVSRILDDTASDWLAAVPTQLEEFLEDWPAHLAQYAELGIGGGSTFLLGRGDSLAAARTGALVIKEAAKVHAEGMSSAEFRHGPLELVERGCDVIMLAGDPKTVDLNRGLATDIENIGGTVAWLGPEPGPGTQLSCPACTGIGRPLGEIVPLQLVSIAVGESRGVEPGVFRNMAGVTRVL